MLYGIVFLIYIICRITRYNYPTADEEFSHVLFLWFSLHERTNECKHNSAGTRFARALRTQASFLPIDSLRQEPKMV